MTERETKHGGKQVKQIRIVAVLFLAAGLLAIAAGGAFLRSGTTAERPQKTFADYMRDGDIYADNGSYYMAIASYQSALEQQEEDPEALAALADVYYKQMDYDSEAEIRERIAAIDPDNMDNQIRLIEIMIHNKELDSARERTETLMQTSDSEALAALYKEMLVDAPVFSLESGSYNDYQLLSLGEIREGLVVHYTDNDTEPTEESPVFTDEIVISRPETKIRARAYSSLGFFSDETILDFKITKKVEKLERDYFNEASHRTYSICANALEDRDWDNIHTYELAQVRSLYVIGDYGSSPTPMDSVFFGDHYIRYESSYSEKGEETLDFVKYMPFLKTLAVSYQKDLDLKPLHSLKYLEELSLLNDGIQDISPLKGLKSLRRLALGWNKIEDAKPLSGLTSLESLGLWNNKISDISSLENLQKLTYFDISHNKVSDISVISKMTGLTEVWINDNRIADYSPLDNCPNLAVLMQADNPVTNEGSIRSRMEQLYKTDLQ